MRKDYRQSLAVALSLATLCFAAISCSVDANVSQAPQKTSDWRMQVTQLDQAIEAKTNQMNLYRAKAARAQNQADRLQFSSRDVTEARRYWQIADYYNAQADLLSMEISQLRTQRSDIMSRNNAGALEPQCAEPSNQNDAPAKPV